MPYTVAPKGWTHRDPNPFTSDGNYGSEWSCFRVCSDQQCEVFTGRGPNGLFAACFRPDVEHLDHHLADFLRYETQQRRRVIVSFPQGEDADATIDRALAVTPPVGAFRSADPKIVVHSTTADAWNNIRRDGVLKSLARLKAEGLVCRRSEVERYRVNEPEEYVDNIVFGAMDSPSPELVVLSKAKGAFVRDPNTPYEPGCRLYFDNYRIIESGRGERDGLHLIKIRSELPLDGFLVAAITSVDADPERLVRVWTPAEFVERANTVLLGRLSRYEGA